MFFFGNNRCETDLCSKRIGGDKPYQDYPRKQNGSGICSWICAPDGAATTTYAVAAPMFASKVSAPLWWLVPTMKASAVQGAEIAPKSLQFSMMSCGDESIRRRNKRAVHEKKTTKHAPFSYRKSILRVLPRKRRKSATTQSAEKSHKYINKYIT